MTREEAEKIVVFRVSSSFSEFQEARRLLGLCVEADPTRDATRERALHVLHKLYEAWPELRPTPAAATPLPAAEPERTRVIDLDRSL